MVIGIGAFRTFSAQRSLKILDQLITSPRTNNEPLDAASVQAVSMPWNVLLSKWKKEFLEQPNDTIQPQKVLQTVDKWRELLNANGDRYWKDQFNVLLDKPNTTSYTYILEAAAAKTKLEGQDVVENNAAFADSLLTRLLEDSKTDFEIQPTSAMFAAVCKTWANVTRTGTEIDPPASTKIEEWIQRMTELHEQGWPALEPNIVIWNTLLSALSKEGNVAKIEGTIQKMIQNEIPGVSPDTVSFSTLLAAYSRLNTAAASLNADSLLNQMLELYESGVDSAKPNTFSFTNVIQCHAQCGNFKAMESWLRKLEGMYEQTQDADWKPDLPVYNTCLRAHAQFGTPEETEFFLKSRFPSHAKPNERSFNIVLSAWARAGDPYRAEGVLLEMHDLYVKGDLDTKPTVVSYNTVLSAYARLVEKDSKNKASNVKKNEPEHTAWKGAEHIVAHMESLHEMGDDAVQPNERTWNIIIDIYSKSGKADVAEKVLQKLLDAPDGKPTIRTWNTVLAACMRRADISRAIRLWDSMESAHISPDIVTYNTYLNCFVRASVERRYGKGGKHGITKKQEEDAVEKIYQLLRGSSKVSQNRITYLAMINFWISRDKPERAESFLFQSIHDAEVMEERKRLNGGSKGIVPPDRDLFHRVMAAWILYKQPKKSERLLLRMSELESRGFDLRPNVDTYNLVLECWAKSARQDSGERAEFILREMEALSCGGDMSVRPNIVSFNQVLNAWANSRNPSAATRTDSLILEMILKQNPDTLPDSISYDTWLKTISVSEDQNKPRRAQDVVKMMNIHDFKPSPDLLKKIRDLNRDTQAPQ